MKNHTNYFLPLNGTKHSVNKQIINTANGFPTLGRDADLATEGTLVSSECTSSSGISSSSSLISEESVSLSIIKTVSVLFKV